jgi:dienelactone hydrolase
MLYAVAPLKHAPESNWRLAEALEFLNGPNFLPAASDPARIEFAGQTHFTFPTPRPCEHQENDIVHGRLFRCPQRWRDRPAIILLDGAPSVGYHTALPWIARWLNRAGFNAALLVAPYRLHRRPRRPPRLRPIEKSCLHFAHAMAQNVAEIRALTGWLLDEGCPSIGLLGISFGGWTAGLTACSDARIAGAVLAFPRVRMRCDDAVIWPRVREALAAQKPAWEAMDTTRLNLILSTPLIPKENILLIEGLHDLSSDRQAIEDLWQKWHHPEIWRLPYGHLNGRLDLIPRMLRWLAPKLEAAQTRTPRKSQATRPEFHAPLPTARPTVGIALDAAASALTDLCL